MELTTNEVVFRSFLLQGLKEAQKDLDIALHGSDLYGSARSAILDQGRKLIQITQELEANPEACDVTVFRLVSPSLSTMLECVGVRTLHELCFLGDGEMKKACERVGEEVTPAIVALRRRVNQPLFERFQRERFEPAL